MFALVRTLMSSEGQSFGLTSMAKGLELTQSITLMFYLVKQPCWCNSLCLVLFLLRALCFLLGASCSELSLYLGILSSSISCEKALNRSDQDAHLITCLKVGFLPQLVQLSGWRVSICRLTGPKFKSVPLRGGPWSEHMQQATNRMDVSLSH